MSDSTVYFDSIKAKITRLDSDRQQWKQKAEKLEQEMVDLKQTLEKVDAEKSKILEEHKMLKMAKSLNKDEVKTTDTKLKINELVKEIDQCLALLNK